MDTNVYSCFISICKSKAEAIKCCKEIKITAHPNEWRNIPLCPLSGLSWKTKICGTEKLSMGYFSICPCSPPCWCRQAGTQHLQPNTGTIYQQLFPGTFLQPHKTRIFSWASSPYLPGTTTATPLQTFPPSTFLENRLWPKPKPFICYKIQ